MRRKCSHFVQFEVGGAKRVWWAFLFPPWVERNFRRMRKGPNHKTLSCSVTTGLIRLISLVWVAGWSTNYRASFTTVRFTVDLQRRRRRRKSRTKTTGFRHVWCLDPWVYEYSYEYMNIQMSIWIFTRRCAVIGNESTIGWCDETDFPLPWSWLFSNNGTSQSVLFLLSQTLSLLFVL